MRITEIQIKLVESPTNENILAFASIVFDDCFVVHDVKILQTAKGLRAVMASKKLTDRCPYCETKNHLVSRYCGQCGSRLNDRRAKLDESGRYKLHADAFHPITTAFRVEVEREVLAAYSVAIADAELARGREAVPA